MVRRDLRVSMALGGPVRQRIDRIRSADIVVGIPSYSSGPAILNVIRVAAEGLIRYYGGAKAVIVVSDGGSTGIPGRGSGLRAVFEAAGLLNARAVAVFDSDLLSIRPEWVRNLLDPVMDGYDFVAPCYQRFRLDGTFVNAFAHDLTRALYGLRIHQPAGGDFGLSGRLARAFMEDEDWETATAGLGIDIWMTTTAFVRGFRISQARLGPKVHGEKKKVVDLGTVFRHVSGTIFRLMAQHEECWQEVRGSKEVPVLGERIVQEPSTLEIPRGSLLYSFNTGFRRFQTVWRRVLEERDMDVVRALHDTTPRNGFVLPVDTWVRIVYGYASAFRTGPGHRLAMLDSLVPLYHARVASLTNELEDMSPEESERLLERDATAFERGKAYLLSLWKKEAEERGGGSAKRTDVGPVGATPAFSRPGTAGGIEVRLARP